MKDDDQDPFGDYATESQTAGQASIRKSQMLEEIDIEKYGIAKPRRLVVRGIIAADKSREDKQG